MIGRTLEIKAYFKHRNIRSIMRFYSYSICILFTCYLILKHWGFPFSTCLKNIAEDLHRFVSSAVPFVLTWYTQSSWGARRLPESLNESIHEYFQDRANTWVTPPQLVCCAGLVALNWQYLECCVAEPWLSVWNSLFFCWLFQVIAEVLHYVFEHTLNYITLSLLATGTVKIYFHFSDWSLWHLTSASQNKTVAPFISPLFLLQSDSLFFHFISYVHWLKTLTILHCKFYLFYEVDCSSALPNNSYFFCKSFAWRLKSLCASTITIY